MDFPSSYRLIPKQSRASKRGVIMSILIILKMLYTDSAIYVRAENVNNFLSLLFWIWCVALIPKRKHAGIQKRHAEDGGFDLWSVTDLFVMEILLTPLHICRLLSYLPHDMVMQKRSLAEIVLSL